MINIKIFPSSESLSQEVTQHFILKANDAIKTKGRFSVALAGGSTPQKSYQLLASPLNANHVNWSKVHLFWGDERCVPPDDNESNYHMVKETLLKQIDIPASHIHRMEGELNPENAAHRYQNLLKDFFGEIPQFDLVILGMGADGHTASLFPGTEALHETSDWVSANYVDKLAAWRITLTYNIINHAHTITFVVSGANKAETLNKVLEGQYKPDLYPSQRIQPDHGELNWYIDKNAAHLLYL